MTASKMVIIDGEVGLVARLRGKVTQALLEQVRDAGVTGIEINERSGLPGNRIDFLRNLTWLRELVLRVEEGDPGLDVIESLVNLRALRIDVRSPCEMRLDALRNME